MGGESMPVKDVNEVWHCNVCGNEIKVLKVGGGELVCCDQPMERIES